MTRIDDGRHIDGVDIPGLSHKQSADTKAFMYEMERKLTANAHKSGWHEDHPLELLSRLVEESGELAGLLNQHPDKWRMETIIAEAADVANFAMMIQSAAREHIKRRR